MSESNGVWECPVHGTGVAVTESFGKLRCNEILKTIQIPCNHEVRPASLTLADVYADPTGRR